MQARFSLRTQGAAGLERGSAVAFSTGSRSCRAPSGHRHPAAVSTLPPPRMTAPGSTPEGLAHPEPNWELPTQWAGPGKVAPPPPGPVAVEDLELFVSCAPSVAIQQQFEQRHPTFITLHDVGPTGSRRLLTGVAAALHRPMQRLLVRRRSFGDLLATLHFLELPGTTAEPLRLYTTDVEADESERAALRQVLLAHARLGVVMVGGTALRDPEAALRDLTQAMARPPWPNRHLLLLPMGPALKLASAGQDLAVRHGLQVLTTPVVNRPSEAWHFIQSSFGRLQVHGVLSPPRRAFGPVQPDPRDDRSTSRPPSTLGGEGEPTQPSGLASRGQPGAEPPADADPWAFVPQERPPGPITGAAGFRTTGSPHGSADQDLPWTEPPAAPDSAPALAALLQRVGRLGGFVAGCIFHLASGRALAHLGDTHEAQAMGRRAAALLNAANEAARGLHLDPGHPEVWITLADHHLIVRPVAGHRGLGLHLLLDRQVANPMLARVQLQRLDEDPSVPAPNPGL